MRAVARKLVLFKGSLKFTSVRIVVGVRLTRGLDREHNNNYKITKY